LFTIVGRTGDIGDADWVTLCFGGEENAAGGLIWLEKSPWGEFKYEGTATMGWAHPGLLPIHVYSETTPRTRLCHPRLVVG